MRISTIQDKDSKDIEIKLCFSIEEYQILMLLVTELTREIVFKSMFLPEEFKDFISYLYEAMHDFIAIRKDQCKLIRDWRKKQPKVINKYI